MLRAMPGALHAWVENSSVPAVVAYLIAGLVTVIRQVKPRKQELEKTKQSPMQPIS